MSKDPAFLFYYQDFAYGTRQMSFEEKGAYIELLCEQADIGHLNLDNIKRILKDKFPIWESICKKYKTDENGLFFNEVLEKRINERKKYIESRKNNLMKLHMGNHMDSHMNHHMENRNRNRNNNNININIKEGECKEGESKKEKKTPPDIQELKKYIQENNYSVDYQTFYDFYESKGWMIGKNKMKSWQASVRTWQKSSIPALHTIPKQNQSAKIPEWKQEIAEKLGIKPEEVPERVELLSELQRQKLDLIDNCVKIDLKGVLSKIKSI